MGLSTGEVAGVKERKEPNAIELRCCGTLSGSGCSCGESGRTSCGRSSELFESFRSMNVALMSSSSSSGSESESESLLRGRKVRKLIRMESGAE